MKNLIKQILREETSGLSDAEKNAAYKLMNMLTKRYHWYTDSPEQPFEITPGSIWLINPETKEWMFELKKSGQLWWFIDSIDNFFKFLNMRQLYFESFIKIWVEDVLKKEVTETVSHISNRDSRVNNIINNGQQLK